MRRDSANLVLIALVLLLLAACGNKQEISAPVVDSGTQYVRNLSGYVEFGAVAAALRTKNPEFTEGCLQLVDYTVAGETEVDHLALEVSADACPNDNALVSGDAVRAKFRLKQEADRVVFYERDEDKPVGSYRQLTDPFSEEVKWLELEELCSGAFANACQVGLSDGKISSIQ